ncbi:MAG: hypothetical protein E7Z68_04480 [Thermoplasmata archaeon]|nr:hypothetical protein [Thermoplasmata archaeon]
MRSASVLRILIRIASEDELDLDAAAGRCEAGDAIPALLGSRSLSGDGRTEVDARFLLFGIVLLGELLVREADRPEEGQCALCVGMRGIHVPLAVLPYDGLDGLVEMLELRIGDAAEMSLDASLRIPVGHVVVQKRVGVRGDGKDAGVEVLVLGIAVEDVLARLQVRVDRAVPLVVVEEALQGLHREIEEALQASLEGAVGMGVLEVLEDECVGEGDEPHLRGVGDVGGHVLEDRGVPAGAGAVFDVQIVLRGRRGGAEPE